MNKVVMGIDTEYEGIYLIARDGEYGLMELHEWSESFDEEELRELDGPEPDGAWYCDYRIQDDIDGQVLGYRYGNTLDELQVACNVRIIHRIATPDMDGYDGLIDWINAQNHPCKRTWNGGIENGI